MALGYKQRFVAVVLCFLTGISLMSCRFRGSVQHTPEEEKEIEIKSLEEMQAHAPPLLEIESIASCAYLIGKL